jgi:hypothetical protein
MNNPRLLKYGALTVALGCWLASPVDVNAQASVVLKDGTRYDNVSVRWSRRENVYQVTRSGRSETSFPIPPDRIQQLNVPAPGGLDAAIDLVTNGDRGEAFRFLETVLSDFAMLNWDIRAAATLAAAHLKDGKLPQAIDICKTIERGYAGRALPPPFYDTYWSALAADGRLPDLEKSVSAAIAAGTPRTAALAAMKRGDIYKGREDWREALISGYLRIIALHVDQRDMLPEALFKAAECFTAMGRHQHADQMRTQLRTGFPQSEYARRLSGAR